METKKPIDPKRDSGYIVIKSVQMPQALADIAVKTTLEGLENNNDLHKAADFVKSQFEADLFRDEETGEPISTKGVWHYAVTKCRFDVKY
ncbi:hypothetical protein AAMO2058_000815200 [Amorphochlora amoebiformis]